MSPERSSPGAQKQARQEDHTCPSGPTGRGAAFKPQMFPVRLRGGAPTFFLSVQPGTVREPAGRRRMWPLNRSTDRGVVSRGRGRHAAPGGTREGSANPGSLRLGPGETQGTGRAAPARCGRWFDPAAIRKLRAAQAQLAEQPPCKRQVAGSSPADGSGRKTCSAVGVNRTW